MVSSSAAHPGMSRLAAGSILLCFAILAAICLTLPILSLAEMLIEIAKREVSITIDKGVYYLFGIGLAFSFLLVDGIYNTLLRRPITKAVARLVNRAAVAGLILVLVLPNLVHFATAYYLKENDYHVFEEQSTQWLFVKNIVYRRAESR